MRWTSEQEVDTEFHRWWAWKPISLGLEVYEDQEPIHKRVWLEWVERRRIGWNASGMPIYEYRLPGVGEESAHP